VFQPVILKKDITENSRILYVNVFSSAIQISMLITSPKHASLNALISPKNFLEIPLLKSVKKSVHSSCMAIQSQTYVANPQHAKLDSSPMTLLTDALGYAQFQKKLLGNLHQEDA
jgi:hypothetical protein